MSGTTPERTVGVHGSWATGERIDRLVEAFVPAVLATIDDALARSGAAQHEAVAGLPPSSLDAATRLERIIDDLVRAGGKFIRPRVVQLGFLARVTSTHHTGDGPDPVELIDSSTCSDLAHLAAAVELLHVFGLLQDDVMDEAATRRGRPTAHVDVARRVGLDEGAAATPAGGGRARRFGESIAVLAGDLAFALAQQQVRGLPPSVLAAWDALVVELVHGQRLDVVFAEEGRFDAASTRRVAERKSAAYTITRPLELGALLAAPDEPCPEWLSTFGHHVGEAFALADDILGVWGEPHVTGKPVGDDIAQRKPTIVLGLAEQELDGQVSATLGADRSPDESEIRDLVAAMDAAGVRAIAEAELDRHVDDALTALADRTHPRVRAALTGLARSVARRHH
ncbi:polyprenyl synthetase family protein [Mobilicoccus pelagius]|uniref:Putative isopentenyl-diphosphate delta-isomerase/polyprenyl diphosphate synthase n=1 Tax=Mobilicoccus pelagius NBRC 104925 TaxID=1089455 RepID=H5UVL7_9MICO|nr:polyprenyl synthetase family protein [Mobilicoccus pelagius]GAB49775.1 putative isopentenyl-diphosphate delta-isomerase/polyprenyl diphosphate synthase [Mobilicoccus pelagius NBRC 104925]